MGFWIGFLVGVIATPIILAIVAKPLMKWFLKRKANNFMNAVTKNVNSKMNQSWD